MHPSDHRGVTAPQMLEGRDDDIPPPGAGRRPQRIRLELADMPPRQRRDNLLAHPGSASRRLTLVQHRDDTITSSPPSHPLIAEHALRYITFPSIGCIVGCGLGEARARGTA